MKIVKIFISLVLLLLSNLTYAEYETYLQVDKSTEKGKYFVLFTLSNTDPTLKDEGSIIHVLLAPGESVSETKYNVLYPGMQYDFKISVDDTSKLFVTVEVSIRKEGSIIYTNKYKTFVTHSSGF